MLYLYRNGEVPDEVWKSGEFLVSRRQNGVIFVHDSDGYRLGKVRLETGGEDFDLIMERPMPDPRYTKEFDPDAQIEIVSKKLDEILELLRR